MRNLKELVHYKQEGITKCKILNQQIIIKKLIKIIKKTCMNSPLGHFHCLILSALAVPKVYWVGWRTRDRILFLWFVSVALVFPATISHNLRRDDRFLV